MTALYSICHSGRQSGIYVIPSSPYSLSWSFFTRLARWFQASPSSPMLPQRSRRHIELLTPQHRFPWGFLSVQQCDSICHGKDPTVRAKLLCALLCLPLPIVSLQPWIQLIVCFQKFPDIPNVVKPSSIIIQRIEEFDLIVRDIDPSKAPVIAFDMDWSDHDLVIVRESDVLVLLLAFQPRVNLGIGNSCCPGSIHPQLRDP